MTPEAAACASCSRRRPTGALHRSKGSIAVDGISLTVNEVDGNRFGVNIISHTQAVTTLGTAKVGQRVNLEVDMLARYVQRLLEHRP
jgi:riboflavin synthase